MRGHGEGTWRVAVFAQWGAPCRCRSCNLCRGRSCGRDAAPRHGRWPRPQGNGLAREVSDRCSKTTSNIATPIECAPTEPRRTIPATRHGAQLGREHIGQGLQPERGQPRMGSAWKRCPSASAPNIAAVAVYHTIHTRSTTSINATTRAWEMLQPEKRYHVWYVVALAPLARVVGSRERCKVEGRRRAAREHALDGRWFVRQKRSGVLRPRSGSSPERWLVDRGS